MTKEQALNYLKSSGFSKEQIQAIVKALSSSDNLSSALEKNSEKLEKDFGESDCISRAEVNQVIEDYMDEQYHVLSDRTRERAFGAKAVKARVNELQPVTPQEPKTGHWIHVMEGNALRVECSECHNREVNRSNFCPNCGAKMDEVEE